MQIAELLAHFSSEELADALYAASLPVAGSKGERIQRLADAVHGTNADMCKVLDLFTADALRAACGCAGLKSGRKADMIESLVSLLGESDSPGNSRSIGGAPPRDYLPPTKENVLAQLREVRIPSRALRTEADVEEVIADSLAPRFQAVSQQYSVGGMLGLKIDLDIGDGQVGVELKLADSILGNTNEFHRLIGQAVYYDHRRYKGNLILCVVGQRGDDEDPLLRDLFSLLQTYNITCICITGA